MQVLTVGSKNALIFFNIYAFPSGTKRVKLHQHLVIFLRWIWKTIYYKHIIRLFQTDDGRFLELDNKMAGEPGGWSSSDIFSLKRIRDMAARKGLLSLKQKKIFA